MHRPFVHPLHVGFSLQVIARNDLASLLRSSLPPNNYSNGVNMHFNLRAGRLADAEAGGLICYEAFRYYLDSPIQDMRSPNAKRS